MRYLSESEILKWSDKLASNKETSLIKLIPRSNLRNRYPDISIGYTSGSSLLGFNISTMESVKIDYIFTFSISEKREKDFLEIFNKRLKVNFSTKSSFSKQNREWVGEPIITDININADNIYNIEKTAHSLSNTPYIRYSYYFTGDIYEIIAYVTYLEDSLNICSMLWGYDEKGNEHDLLKYKIGSIVCVLPDKSKDYIVLDYHFNIVDNNIKISYIVSELIFNNTPVIKYGKSTTLVDEDICFSRNNRIDDILN
jgi:hypothetical protein